MGKLSDITTTMMIITSVLFILIDMDEVRADTLTVSTDGSKMYTSIQDAVDAAQSGDEILISPGSYGDSILIQTDDLFLKNAGGGKVLVESNSIGPAITVRANNVTLESLETSQCSTGVLIDSSNDTRILNCTLNATGYSLDIKDSLRPVLENNTMNSTSMLSRTESAYMYGNKWMDSGLAVIGDSISCWNTHSIDTTNTVNGKDLIYIKNRATDSLNIIAGQLIIANCTAVSVNPQVLSGLDYPLQIGYSTMITITNFNITNCTNGIRLYQTSDSTLAGSSVSDCEDEGILLLESDWNWISDNVIHKCYSGIRILNSDNNTIDTNEVHHNTGNGIEILTSGSRETSNSNLIQQSSCHHNQNGIIISESPRNRILESNLSNNSGDGIFIISTMLSRSSTGNTIEDCEFSLNRINGVDLYYSPENVVESSKFLNNNKTGISTYYSEGTRVSNSTFQREEGGIYSYSGFSMMNNNFFEDCSNYGAGIFLSEQAEARKNQFLGLGSGLFMGMSSRMNVTRNEFNNSFIDLSNTYDSLIYDNKFIDSNISGTGTGTRWNISKTPGKNIIGGPYLGGNYWSNYTGKDLDGDWIGDTDLPHWPGDQLPLQYDIVPPTITDVTEGNPTTGDIFEIRARPLDERLGVFPTLEYWFGEDGEHVNESMIVCDPWGVDISIPSNSLEPLHYVCSVRDDAGNWNNTPVITREVVDNDKPILSLNIQGDPFKDVGEDIYFLATSIENIRMDLARLKYIDVNGMQHNESVYLNIYGYQILPAQKRSGTLTMWLWGMDTSGNINESEKITVTIIDNPSPSIELIKPINGSSVRGIIDFSFNVTDPHEDIEEIALHRMVNSTSEEIEIANWTSEEGLISYEWNTDEAPDGIHWFIIRANDFSGKNSTLLFWIRVDNTPPEADAGEDMSAMAGQIVIFNGTGSTDNLENLPLAFKWSFLENGIPVELTGPVAEYTFRDPGTYTVTLTVHDDAGNSGIDTLEVTVNEPPAAPRVVGSSVIDGSTDVSVEISITIEFSESMDRISVGNSLSLSPVESYRLLWAEENTSLVIEFTDGLTESTLYNLKLDGPLSQDGMALSPVFLLTFTTEEKENLSIRIDIPEGGWKVNREEVFSVSGSISGFSTGTEVTVTLGSETFSTTTGASGNFILEVMAPEEIGTHEMKIRAGDMTESVNVQVVDREENGNDNLLMIIGIVLIVAVLILLAFIWVRRGGRNRYIEE